MDIISRVCLHAVRSLLRRRGDVNRARRARVDLWPPSRRAPRHVLSMPARAASDYGSELEYDAAVDAELRALEAAATASLWQRFRQRRGWGALSVSDLSGPAWCEAQHAYRLASKAHLPPLERPATITTASGASVAVDPARTAQREHVLEGGRSVHARIETEVMGDHDEVDVDVAGDEDWWALRVLNTAVCLEALLDKGRVRELPVVGWVGAFLVFGVCDEVERRELSPARARPAPPIPSASAASVDAHTRDRRHDAGEADCVAVRTSDAPPCRPSTPPRSGQRTLDAFFSPVPSPKRRAAAARAELVSPSLGVPSDCPDGAEVANDPQPSPRWGFVLSDTKTRQVVL